MKKVALGMSGGVDSSVAAVLLLEAGYEVIPVFMRNWDSTVNNEHIGINIAEEDVCPQEQDYKDAKFVCDKLGLPLYKLNFVDEYWNDVFTYFLTELEAGRTPNPDMMCNKYIKFDAFKKACEEYDVDYFAFGHYAILDDENNLKRAVDKNKDQTYFLAMVDKCKFENVLFPIGHLTKKEVRCIAEKHGLATANKKDSTGICFIGNRDFPQFLKNYFESQKGKVIDIASEKIVGEHNGLVNYTIGQRKGLNVGGYSSALYVVAKSLKQNILYVADENNKHYLTSVKCQVKNFNFLKHIEEVEFKCHAKFRYRQELHEVKVKLHADFIEVVYLQGVDAVTPGQTCVLYKGDICLGGGIIETVFNAQDQVMVYF